MGLRSPTRPQPVTVPSRPAYSRSAGPKTCLNERTRTAAYGHVRQPSTRRTPVSTLSTLTASRQADGAGESGLSVDVDLLVELQDGDVVVEVGHVEALVHRYLAQLPLDAARRPAGRGAVVRAHGHRDLLGRHAATWRGGARRTVPKPSSVQSHRQKGTQRPSPGTYGHPPVHAVRRGEHVLAGDERAPAVELAPPGQRGQPGELGLLGLLATHDARAPRQPAHCSARPRGKPSTLNWRQNSNTSGAEGKADTYHSRSRRGRRSRWWPAWCSWTWRWTSRCSAPARSTTAGRAPTPTHTNTRPFKDGETHPTGCGPNPRHDTRQIFSLFPNAHTPWWRPAAPSAPSTAPGARRAWWRGSCWRRRGSAAHGADCWGTWAPRRGGRSSPRRH